MARRKAPPPRGKPVAMPASADLAALLSGFFDPEWYAARYPDIAAGNHDPLEHFIRYGAAEQRDPNRFFESEWYLDNNPDVAASGANPLLHYLTAGAAELRWPHRRFDAAWYVEQHPEAASNPLVYHLRVGLAAGYLTEMPRDILEYLPSAGPERAAPSDVFADAVVVVGPGSAAAQRCLRSVLADRALPLARIIVVSDRTAGPDMRAWLGALARDGQIHWIQSRRALGLAAAAALGIADAEGHDVVLLSGDPVVPPGWVSRLAGHAHAHPRIATVSALGSDARLHGFGDDLGIPVAPEVSAAQADGLCRATNAGRASDVPVALGPCVYIRADALRALGGLDTAAFPAGDAAIADFCLRAAGLGWRHRLAWDIYADGRTEEGRTEEGRTEEAPAGAAGPAARSPRSLLDRHPDCCDRIKLCVGQAAERPYRFAMAAALMRQTGLPVILMVTHHHGGGVRRHIDSLAAMYAGRARIPVLEGGDHGVALSVPGQRDCPVLPLPYDRMDDLVLVLRSMALSRVHVHHLMGVGMDVRRLLRRLDLPFDLTVHDYYAICPQVNLLPWPERLYCGEPAPAVCNACVAENNAHGARDIFSWRRDRAWQFIEAGRVICPSEDVRVRLERHGLARNAIVVPHEQQTAKRWKVVLPEPPGPALRIAVLGVLANHKGARTVAALAEAAEPGTIEIHLIGEVEDSFPKPVRDLIKISGRYQEAELGSLIAARRPHVFWFPSSAPETYSYTLTTAIDTGLPIVATDLGAFPERLAGRPNTWLVSDRSPAEAWLRVFATVRARLRDRARPPPAPRRPAVSDFYADRYLAPASAARPGRRKIVIVPERQENGALTTKAYLRLLQPLDHPSVSDRFDVVLADAEAVLGYRADMIVTQRAAIPDPGAADALAAHASRTGAVLAYDLDGDLLTVPKGGAGTDSLRQASLACRRMLAVADRVWLSTHALAARLASVRRDPEVLETRLDERIWDRAPPAEPFWDDPVRVLCMGPATREADFAMIMPALVRLKAEFGHRVCFDILGMTSQRALPDGLNRTAMTAHAARSYPGFVHWLTAVRPSWHIGLAPLLDTPGNRFKSAAVALDYAAMGMVVLASDAPAYRGSIADGKAGQLVANTPAAWHAALSWLIRDQDARQAGQARARAAFLAGGTLAGQAGQRLAALAAPAATA